MDPSKLFHFLVPKSDSPEDTRNWRGKIAGILTLGTMAIVGILFLLIEFHVNPPSLGLRFITTAAAEEVHDQVQNDLSEIKGSVESLVASDQERALREKAREIREVRESILSLALQACQSEGALRTSLLQQLGMLRSDYMALTGEEFPATPCGDLLGD